MPDRTTGSVNVRAMSSFRYGGKISRQIFNKHNSTPVDRILASNRTLAFSVLFCDPRCPVGSFNAVSPRRILLQYLQTSDTKSRSPASIHRELSTRAASGSESPESGIGPGPGPGSRRMPPDCGKRGETSPQRPEPSGGSSSKCLEEGYGKPLKPPRRSLLNFCKRLLRLKEKPSNCPPCPPPEPEESFWDYLFKFDERTIPEPSTCRIAHRHREACRKTDPRLSDPRYRRTGGDVLIFTEPPRPSCCAPEEPQPRPPPLYALPKAVACRRFVEAASSPYPDFPKAKDEVKDEVKARCSSPRRFRVPFEECRPPRRPRESFSCERGVSGTAVAPPMALDRGTCGGRSVGEFLAEATISQTKTSTLPCGVVLGTKCEPSVANSNTSRLQRLQQLTKAANCGKELSKTTVQSFPQDKRTRRMSTEAHSLR